MEEEVTKFKYKFGLALMVQIPIFTLMWVIPYTNRELMIHSNGIN
jgi:hypothetical protein